MTYLLLCIPCYVAVGYICSKYATAKVLFATNGIVVIAGYALLGQIESVDSSWFAVAYLVT